MNKDQKFKYWAFISYSHTDEKWGRWLHKKLETYRIPKKLIDRTTEQDYKIPKRLFPIFRDREELPVSADLNDNINKAIRESRYLIVICSPRSAVSLWVNEEIRIFKSLGRENRVLCLIVDGEPNATDKPNCGMLEAFPKTIRYKVDEQGKLTQERIEPIAADIRPGKDGKKNSSLKILAGLMGISFNELKRREKIRQRRRKIQYALFSFLIIVFGFMGFRLMEIKNQQAIHLKQSQNDFILGFEKINKDRSEGLKYLARSLRANPRNKSTALRICNALQNHFFALPFSSRITHDDQILFMEFSPDGKKVATASHDGTASIWDVNGNLITGPLKHWTTVHEVHFSPDGKRILTVCGWHFKMGTIHIWDVEKGSELTPIMKHGEYIFSAEFSPDGNRIVSASADKTVKIWNANSGMLMTPPILHNSYVRLARFDPSGKRIFSICNDEVLRIWEVQSGEMLVESIPHNGWVESAWFNPDGMRIISYDKNSLHFLDSSTGEEKGPAIHSLSKINSVAFSAKIGRLVILDGNQNLLVRNGETGLPVGITLKHQKEVAMARFSQDGRRIATASSEGELDIWDIESGNLLSEPLFQNGKITSIQFNPDGKLIATAWGERNKEGSARIWFVDPGTSKLELLSLKNAGYLACFSPDGKIIASISEFDNKGVVNLRKTENGDLLFSSLRTTSHIRSVAFSFDGKKILTATGDPGRIGFAQVWDVFTGKAISPPMQHLDGIFKAKFSPDGKFIVTISFGQTIRLWDAETGSAVTPNLPHGDQVNTAEFSPDGRYIVTGSGSMVSKQHDDFLKKKASQFWNKVLKKPDSNNPKDENDQVTGYGSLPQSENFVDAAWIWNVGTGKLIIGPIFHDNSVSNVRFSPDGEHFLTGCGSQFRGGSAWARLWETKSGKPISPKVKLEGSVRTVEFSPDGQKALASCSASSKNGTIYLWEPKTGIFLNDSIRHSGYINTACFDSEGKWVLTASSDKSVVVWDVQTGKPVIDPIWHNDAVHSAEFSLESRTILTNTQSGDIFVWNLAIPFNDKNYILLSEIIDVIMGERLNNDDTVEPISKNLKELMLLYPAVGQKFPFQFESVVKYTK